MYGNMLVAVFPSLVEADRARARLIQSGVPQVEIRLSNEEPAPAVRAVAERRPGFWDWLLGSNVSEADRSWYQTNLHGGRTALSVLAKDDVERDRFIGILEEFNPLDLKSTAEEGGPVLGTATAPAGGPIVGMEHRVTGAETVREADQVIPVVKEELDVGKRVTERSYRVRTYVIEKPVEETVNLRDERVVVERRPVTDKPLGAEADLPAEREFEVIERHEEPVVGKRARQTEEVVVRKEAEERSETVQGTVRETQVDVDKEPRETAMPTGPKP